MPSRSSNARDANPSSPTRALFTQCGVIPPRARTQDPSVFPMAGLRHARAHCQARIAENSRTHRLVLHDAHRLHFHDVGQRARRSTETTGSNEVVRSSRWRSSVTVRDGNVCLFTNTARSHIGPPSPLLPTFPPTPAHFRPLSRVTSRGARSWRRRAAQRRTSRRNARAYDRQGAMVRDKKIGAKSAGCLGS